MYHRINAIQNGNWSDPNTWYGGILPNSESEVYCNSFNITVDTDIEAKMICNDSTYPDVIGGNLIVNDSVTINAHLYSAFEEIIILNSNYLRIVGVLEGSRYVSDLYGITNYNTGIIEISGVVKGGYGEKSYGIKNNSNGIISVSGVAEMGLGFNSYGIYNQNNGKIIINGVESTENGGYGDIPQF